MITKWRQFNNHDMKPPNAMFYEGGEHNSDDGFSFPFLKLHRAFKNSTPDEN